MGGKHRREWMNLGADIRGSTTLLSEMLTGVLRVWSRMWVKDSRLVLPFWRWLKNEECSSNSLYGFFTSAQHITLLSHCIDIITNYTQTQMPKITSTYESLSFCGSKFGGSLAEWFWLSVFHEVATEMLTMATVLWKLDWDLGAHFKVHSHGHWWEASFLTIQTSP